MTKIDETKLPGVFRVQDENRVSLATKSLIEGQSVYGEKIIKSDGEEYRLWSTRRSKLGAAIQKGLREMPIQQGSRVLYLGAASGTTVSHVSDIIGPKGMVYAVEFSLQVARKLVFLAETRPNIVPIIGDARYPSKYTSLVGSGVDVVYQDVAQSDQARILCDNMNVFSSFGGWGMIAIKARSIDSASRVDRVYSKEISELSRRGTEIVENIDLAPLEKDHRFVIVRATEELT